MSEFRLHSSKIVTFGFQFSVIFTSTSFLYFTWTGRTSANLSSVIVNYILMFRRRFFFFFRYLKNGTFSRHVSYRASFRHIENPVAGSGLRALRGENWPKCSFSWKSDPRWFRWRKDLVNTRTRTPERQGMKIGEMPVRSKHHYRFICHFTYSHFNHGQYICDSAVRHVQTLSSSDEKSLHK